MFIYLCTFIFNELPLKKKAPRTLRKENGNVTSFMLDMNTGFPLSCILGLLVGSLLPFSVFFFLLSVWDGLETLFLQVSS